MVEHQIYGCIAIISLNSDPEALCAKKNGCDRNLQGMNGAILAYGQTASGKTFSISGSTVGHPRLGVWKPQHTAAALKP